MLESHFSQAFENSADLKIFALEMELTTQILLPWINELPKPTKILDIAAGQGIEAKALQPYVSQSIALEPSEIFLSNSYHNVNVQGFAQKLPFGRDIFSGILCKDAIMFLSPEMRQDMFSEISRVLRPGGSLMIVSQRSDALRIYYLPQESQYPQKETFSTNKDWNMKLEEVSLTGKPFSVEFVTLPNEFENLAKANGLDCEFIEEYSKSTALGSQNRWMKISGFVVKIIKK